MIYCKKKVLYLVKNAHKYFTLVPLGPYWIIANCHPWFKEVIDHDDGHSFDDFNVTYDSLLSQTQFASRYECQDLVDNCIKLQRENRKNYSLLQRQMRFYEDDVMNTYMNQRKMVQDARRRQAVVLVNRNFYRYHVEKIKFV